MRSLPALRTLDALEEPDIEWIMDTGEEVTCIASHVLIREGHDPGAIYIVLDGLFEIHIKAVQEGRIGVLGAGEIVGEIAFIESGVASATISAVETSRVLELPYSRLRSKVESDTGFAARLYRALAQVNIRRLRSTTAALGHGNQQIPAADTALQDDAAKLMQVIEQFREFTAGTEAELLKDDTISEELMARFHHGFREFYATVNSIIGDSSPLHAAARAELGRRAQIQVLPYVLLTETAERFYSKPRGYAGDFYTIEKIYRDQPGGAGRLGPVLDAAFLKSPAANAVKNRRGLLREEIVKTIGATQSDRPARILSLACGPARELFDAFETVADREKIAATLVDIDLQALAFVSDRRDKLRLQNRITPIHGNLLHLALGRQKLDLPPQDLVYSIGLIDYFNDKFVIKLLNWIHTCLAPGGRVILGNFHPSNNCKAFMDYILDWRLIHRTEEDMNRLFESSAFGRPCTSIRYEDERVNLFAECVKE